MKTRELARYLAGNTKNLDFVSPGYEFQRVNSQEIRQKILKISYADWKKLGFSKGILHYMKQNAKSELFSLNSHVLERVQAWKNLQRKKGDIKGKKVTLKRLFSGNCPQLF